MRGAKYQHGIDMTKPAEIHHTVPRARIFAGQPGAVHATEHLLDGDILPHDHEFIEIAVAAAGTGRHQSIHGMTDLSRGDVIILQQDGWHAYRQCRKLRVYNCYVGPELLEGPLAWVLDDPRLHRLLWQPLAAPGCAVTLLHLRRESLRACLLHVRHLCRLSVQGGSVLRRVAALLQLLEVLGDASREPPPGAARPDEPVHPAVRAAVQLMGSALDERWTLDEIARGVHVSSAYLVRLFRRHTGDSPMTWLARRRMEKAAAMLLSTRRPVGEIAARVGVDDPNYFARRFKAVFGVSPTDYRDRNRVR